MPDGQIADFYVKEEVNACCILALNDKNEVILVEQFRPGPNKILLELPGGSVERGHTPLEAIGEELISETGYDGDIEFVVECQMEGYAQRKKYCYVALNCKRVANQKLESREFIEVKLMNLAKFREHLKSGQLTDVEVGYLGLDYLGLL